MSGIPSLNDSITAAWNTAPVQKKRARRTLPVNDISTPLAESSTASSTQTPLEQPQSTPPAPKRKRPKTSSSTVAAKYAPPEVGMNVLGGLQSQITQLLEIVALALVHPEIYMHTGVPRPKGVLLHGVPGGGKTQLVKCLAGELQLPFISISAPSIVSGILDPALRRAGRFDHEIEMGVPTQEGREQILRVLCSKLRISGDVDFRALAKSTPGYIGADLTALTTEAGVIAVKRIFEEMGTGEREFPEPDGLENMVIDDVPFSNLPQDIRDTPIAKFLISHPSPLTPDQLATISLTPADFIAALKIVQPSAKREGFATIPDVTWSDIGALSAIRDELHMAIVQPIRHPELFSVVGIDAPSGVLLWGPPGCGKTLLAKAVANESRANFISVKGPELLNKYVGESERAVRQVFIRARASSPCVIFFDELDALVPRRDDSMSESSARVVNTLLTELDGLDSRKAVYVIGATNRPDMIDPAMVRPGRLDKLLYVDLPSATERFEILKTHTKKTPINEDAWSDIKRVITSDKCDGFSGADVAALVREAATLALRGALEAIGMFEASVESEPMDIVEKGTKSLRVLPEHFAKAAQKTLPSVSKEQRHKYERMRDKYAGVPTKRKNQRETEAVIGENEVKGYGMIVDDVGGGMKQMGETAFVT
ncbi:hypothetical protein L204_105214 [Cryptococcus depauperatus]